MKNFMAFWLVPMLCLLAFVDSVPQSSGATVQPARIQKFEPWTLGRSQLIAEAEGIPTRLSAFDYYKAAFTPTTGSDAFATGVSYIDFLTTVEVMVQAWEKAVQGRRATDDELRFMLCFWSVGIGCPVKSAANRAKATQGRDRIMAGAYFASIVRTDIVRRLRDPFLRAEHLNKDFINYETRDIEDFVDIR